VRRSIAALLVAAPGLAPAPPVLGHDIPAAVGVLAFLKPEDRRLHLLVRAPLGAMRDVDYPTRGPGYLDLARAESALLTAARLWIADTVELFEEDRRLGGPSVRAVRVSLPSDRSFASYAEAVVHLLGPPLPQETELYWSQGTLDVWFEYEITTEASRFSLRLDLSRLGQRVVTGLRFLPAGGGVRPFELRGEAGLVRLDPRWHQAALRFVGLGFLHILEGIDHLLFVFCLVAPFRRVRELVLLVTAFSLAHSLTLVASAFRLGADALWFPPLVETLIALSIVYMALENILAPRLARRWLTSFGFGLVHGFGFSFGLQESLQFAGSHLLTSLLCFNLGVELGQLVVLAVLVPALAGLFRLLKAERACTILLSALVAHTGWHWTLERFDRLRQFRFQWPEWDAALLAGLTRWLLLGVVAAALARLMLVLLRSPSLRRVGGQAATGPEE
jgi:hypothetical protein